MTVREERPRHGLAAQNFAPIAEKAIFSGVVIDKADYLAWRYEAKALSID